MGCRGSPLQPAGIGSPDGQLSNSEATVPTCVPMKRCRSRTDLRRLGVDEEGKKPASSGEKQKTMISHRTCDGKEENGSSLRVLGGRDRKSKVERGRIPVVLLRRALRRVPMPSPALGGGGRHLRLIDAGYDAGQRGHRSLVEGKILLPARYEARKLDGGLDLPTSQITHRVAVY
jgi:hypothetical protein